MCGVRDGGIRDGGVRDGNMKNGQLYSTLVSVFCASNGQEYTATFVFLISVMTPSTCLLNTSPFIT